MDVPWKKIEVCTLRFAMLVWRQRLCKKVGKRTSSVNNWKEWKVVQAKKTGNRKKDVFVPILFLYLEKHLYKILIYNMLLYIKITFTRFNLQNNTSSTFYNILSFVLFFLLFIFLFFNTGKIIKVFCKRNTKAYKYWELPAFFIPCMGTNIGWDAANNWRYL